METLILYESVVHIDFPFINFSLIRYEQLKNKEGRIEKKKIRSKLIYIQGYVDTTIKMSIEGYPVSR